MDKLQKQSQEMKQSQQEISSMKKQLSETKGFFKGKERKSLESKIKQTEKLEKRIHTDMEQNVKQAGYPDVQSFAKAYHKSEELIREYNKDLREWKNQTAQKKKQTSDPPTKISVLKNCTAISRNVYLDLLMSYRLNSYLVDIEEQAQGRFERIIEQMKQAQGITEQLKADNAWEWVGRRNNIQACAREIVNRELIYQQ